MRSYIVAAFVFTILHAGAPALAAPTSANKATDKVMPQLEHAFDCMGKAIANGHTQSFTKCLPASAPYPATPTSETLLVNMRRAHTTSSTSASSESSETAALESDATRSTTIPVKRHATSKSDNIKTSTATSETLSAVVRRATSKSSASSTVTLSDVAEPTDVVVKRQETASLAVRRTTSESLSSSTVTLSDAAEPSDVVVKRQEAGITYAAAISASASMSMGGDASATVLANPVATGMADAVMGASMTMGAYASFASDAAGMLVSVGTNLVDGASATMKVGASGTNAAYLNLDGASVSMYANPTATGAADMSMSIGLGVDGDASSTMFRIPFVTNIAHINKSKGSASSATSSAHKATKTAHKFNNTASDHNASSVTDLEAEELSGMSSGSRNSDSEDNAELDYALGDGDSMDVEGSAGVSADYYVSASMM